MTPAERAVIEAALSWASSLDAEDAIRDLIDACSVLINERIANGVATFTDADGDVWKLRENGCYSMHGPIGAVTLEYIRKYHGERK